MARISLTSGGVELGVFTEVEGLDIELEVVDYQAPGSSPRFPRKPPDTRSPPIVTLKRPKPSDTRITLWHQANARGQANAKKNCTLTMYGSSGQPVARYQLESAWPSKIEVGGLKAGGQGEAVTLTCLRIRRIPH